MLGRLLALVGAAQLVPAACSLWYREQRSALAFLASAAVALVIGLILARFRADDERLYRREGVLIVVAGWLLASTLGALPFVLSGDIPNPIDALFESASGFTTTGASILTDIEACSRGVLFWRSMTQWLGGLGIIVLFVALLSGLGPGVRFLYSLEVPGPTKEVLHPRVRATAVVLLRIYVALTVAETVLLMVAGLDLFDAITHSFSTLSTGGFSPRAASVAAYPEPAVQLIITVFMLVAGVNFSLLYSAIKGRFHLWLDRELLLYLGLTIAAAAVIAIDLAVHQVETPGSAPLDSAFQVVSIMTTTGFATADFDRWPDASRAILVALMLVGGSAGSTAGGIKVMRVLIGLRTAWREVRVTFSPNAVIPVTVGGKLVPDSVARGVAGFLLLYFGALITSTVLLTLGGTELVTAATATIASLGNVGPGLAGVGPIANFSIFAGWEKLLLIALMWLGRLEILAIAALFSPAFWRR